MDTIHVTDSALENIRALRNEMDAAGFGLRFGYSDGGCSGNKYIIEFENEPDEDDLIFDFDDLQVFVKETQMPKLKNSTMLIFKPLNLTVSEQENIRSVADVLDNTSTRRFSRDCHIKPP